MGLFLILRKKLDTKHCIAVASAVLGILYLVWWPVRKCYSSITYWGLKDVLMSQNFIVNETGLTSWSVIFAEQSRPFLSEPLHSRP